MKLTRLLGLCSMVLFSTACGSDDVTTNGSDESTPNVFAIQSTIVQSMPADPTQPTGRAPQLDENGAGSFSSGDVNELLFFTEENKTLQHFSYTYGKTYYWNDIDLPAEVESCQLVAWYPAVSAANPADFAWDVLKQKEQPDLLAAGAVKVSPDQTARVDLTFKHLMHKLQVKVVSENPDVTDQDLQKATVDCQNVLPVAHINLLTGKTTSADGQAANFSQKGAKTAFILPAQNVGDMEVVLNLKGKTVRFKMAEIQVNGQPVKSLESGKTLSVNITVTKNDFIISGQNISGWENQGDFNEDIII